MTQNKLGQIGKLGTIILIIAGAIILYMFIAKFTAKSTFEESINVCRFSVVGQTATEVIPGIREKTSPFNIDCDKRYITFYNTKVELGLSPGNMQAIGTPANNNVKKFNRLTESTVNSVIAEEMRICWFEFGEGKIKVFANDDKAVSWKDDVCFVCSEINFEKSVEKEQFAGLIDYLKNTKIVEQDQTYYEYINGATDSKASWEEYNSGNKKIGMYNTLPYLDKSQQYAVVFKKDYDFFGKNGYYVEVVPTDKLNLGGVCDLQAS